MATITTVFRKDKINKNNQAPIHFRIIKNRKIRYITSELMLDIEDWDFSNNKVKTRVKNSARLNAFLAKKHSDIQDSVLKFETKNKSVSSNQLKQYVFGSEPINIFKFSETILNQYQENNQISTLRRATAVMNKLNDYMQGKPLHLQEITPEFLETYEKHLKTAHNNKVNTIAKDLKFIRRIFNEAYKKDLIEHSAIPFRKYKLKSEKTEREYLTDAELMSIEEVKLTPGTKIEMHRDMFVFASYAGGIRVSDVLKLRWLDFDGTHIHLTMRKTKEQISIKLPNKSLQIIEKYKHLKEGQLSYIFPILQANFYELDAQNTHKALVSSTSLVNNSLNKIRTKLGIHKKLTFHISRHTFATRALRKGIAIDKVQKILGHSDIKETQIYAKIVSSELDNAMDVFND